MAKLIPIKASRFVEAPVDLQEICLANGMVPTNDVFFPHWYNMSDIILLYGGFGCFSGNQYISCLGARKQIKDVLPGDIVLTYNEETGKQEYKPVIKQYKYQCTEKLVCVHLRNGQTIVATQGHEFFFKGGWVSIKDILSLWDEQNRGV